MARRTAAWSFGVLLVGALALALPPAAGAATILFGAHLTGDQEVPPVATDAFGLATVAYDDVAQTLDVTLLVSGIRLEDLAPDPGRFHLHGPAAPGELAGVLVQLGAVGTFVQSGPVLQFSAQDVPLPNPSVLEPFLLSGRTYLNLHTRTWTGGEIRGQLVPEPGTLLLLGGGLLGLAALRRRRA